MRGLHAHEWCWLDVEPYPAISIQITAQGCQHIESNGIDVDALEIVLPRGDQGAAAGRPPALSLGVAGRRRPARLNSPARQPTPPCASRHPA